MNSFELLISNNLVVDRLITGCKSSGSYEDWKAKREFIATIFDSNGTILDIGCANGFFLRCLQAWSCHKLVPYGIDVQAKLIDEAQLLFPSEKSHFIHLNVHDVHMLSECGFPTVFDYVFWNFATNWNIAEKKWRTTFHNVFLLARKRIILGFYGINSHLQGKSPAFDSKEWMEDKQNVEDTATSFEKLGILFTGKKWNPTGWNHLVAWIDKTA
ncbi:unnamed protein product [Rotaria socialis]|uniref:Methyltransferase domain-containing protein n=1 Tax=Rotaria socialis TaxID=392032 RepID=A0A820SXE8_9BILA|nr:unnamed protein product [Rotaria socialis]